MAIFGFIVLCVIAAYWTIVSLSWLYVGLGFTGKIDPVSTILFALSCVLWYIAYVNAPFDIVMK